MMYFNESAQYGGNMSSLQEKQGGMAETGPLPLPTPGSEPGWQFIEDRQLRLQAINHVLEIRNLRQLPKLGNWHKGEIELLKVINIFDHSASFFTDVQFECRYWNNTIGKYVIRFNAKGDVADGAAVFCLINGKAAIIYQWRPTVGAWTYEVARGFGTGKSARYFETADCQTMPLSDLPIDTLMKVVGNEISDFTEIKKIAVTGKTWQNTGTDAVPTTNLLVDLKIDKTELANRMDTIRRFSPFVLYLMDLNEVDEAIGEKINDNHSITAYTLASKYLKNHKFF